MFFYIDNLKFENVNCLEKDKVYKVYLIELCCLDCKRFMSFSILDMTGEQVYYDCVYNDIHYEDSTYLHLIEVNNELVCFDL